MGLQSAMTTSLTGMQGAETIIDVVGNNVANSGTTGFKESNVLFATQFLQTQSIGSAPSADRGGTNPRQTGLGVKVAAINPNFTQGTIQISANPLDVAIQGDGFLIVRGGQGEKLYTRNGQIQTNSSNELVTATGNRVLGLTVDEDFNIVDSGEPVPLRIPLGEAPVTQPTENAYFQGVLTPLAEVGDTPSIISSEVLGDITYEIPPTSFDLGDFTSVTAPNTSSSSATPGVGTLAAGDYRYRVTWYVDNGPGEPSYESSPSGSLTASSLPLNSSVTLDNLPVDNSPSPIWTGRRVYRSIGTGDFELLSEINLTDTSFSDTGALTSGPDVLDDSSLSQGNYSYYVTFYASGSGLESRPTPRIGAIATGVDGRIRIDNLPQPTSGVYDSLRIYRNLSTNSSEFHLVTQTPLPLGISTYIDNAADADIEGNAQVDLMGAKAGSQTFLKDVVLRDGDNYTTPFEAGVLSFTGRKGDRTLTPPKELTITNSTTVLDLIEFMDQAFGIGNPLDDPFTVTSGGAINNGVIDFTSNMGTANALSVALSAFSLTPTGDTEPVTIPLAFTETQVANGEGSTTDFVVFDSLGIPMNVRITTVMEESSDTRTVYRWFATSGDNEPLTGVDTFVGTGTIVFNGSGGIEAGATSTIAIERNQTASDSPLEFTLNFNQVSGLGLQNSLGESTSSVNMTRQDGFPPGTLSSFIITESGLIRGIFSNGAERPLGQIRMARFANNVGLQQVGENLFTVGVNSGDPLIDNPGENGLGSLTAGALELSNTDIGQNLIDLILASTQYRGGARVITTAQQLLDELLSLRR